MEEAMKLMEKDVHEKQDTVISLRKQLDDIKSINLEMYKKLQVGSPIHKYLHIFLISYTSYHNLCITNCMILILIVAYYYIPKCVQFSNRSPNCLINGRNAKKNSTTRAALSKDFKLNHNTLRHC